MTLLKSENIVKDIEITTKAFYYVCFKTAAGTALLKISCVTGHMYRTFLTKIDFLSSGSLTSVKTTGIKSFIFNGLPLIGQ